MTSDLGQMFNLRKTAAGPLPEPASSPEEAAVTPARPGPTTAADEADGASAPRSRQTGSRRTGTTSTRTKAAKPTAAKPATQPTAAQAAAAEPATEPAAQATATEPATEPTAARPERHPEPTERPGVEPAAARSDETGLPAGAPEAIRSDASPAGESSPRSATSTGGRASIMLYTTQTVRERMKEEAQRTSLSYGQLTLFCIENTLDRLEQVFAARVGATSQLFSTDYKPRSRGETRSANLNLHIANRDLDVVESLWQRFPGCRSRNDLLSTACALHLTGEADA